MKNRIRSVLPQRGQATAEFALTLPILVLFILGIIDFGRILFTYAQASNSLRAAVRQAELLGYADVPNKTYLDCDEMEDLARNIYFVDDSDIQIDILYIKANDTTQTYTCATVTDDVLDNGDILQIHLQVAASPLFLPVGDLNLDFQGQRTIVKRIDIGATCLPDSDPDLCDADHDGLLDGWEKLYFGSTSAQNATDDYDGDGCNNGCEETKGTDPTVPDNSTTGGSTDGGTDGGSTGGTDGGSTGGSTDGGSTDGGTDGGSTGGTDGGSTDGGGGAETPTTPQSFVASADCSSGNVSFSWDWGGAVPTRAEIRDAETGLLVVQMDANEPGVMPNNYCADCDSINTSSGSRSYYMFSVNGTPPDEVQGANSNTSSVFCVAPPPAPIAFNATPDCDTGKVDFAWQWGSTNPLPTRAEIRDLGTGAVVATITDTTQTTCEDCDTISTSNGDRDYYIVAINGTSPNEEVSPASNSADAVCNASTYAGAITGVLWLDNNKNGNNDDNTGWGTASTTTLSCTVDDFTSGVGSGWSGTPFGDATSGSHYTENGNLLVTSYGTQYWNTDNGYFVYKSVSGDFRIEVDILSFAPISGGTWQKGGITVREDVSDTARRVMINYAPAQGLLQFGYRSTSGASSVSNRFASDVAVSLPARVALERVGNIYTAYYSTDGGSTWILPGGELGGVVNVSMSTHLIGIAQSSYSNSIPLTGTYDNFEVCQQQTVASNGSVYLSGPNGIYLQTDINSEQAYSFTELPPGTYTLTIPDQVTAGNKTWTIAYVHGGIDQAMSSSSITFTLGNDQSAALNFAYYK